MAGGTVAAVEITAAAVTARNFRIAAVPSTIAIVGTIIIVDGNMCTGIASAGSVCRQQLWLSLAATAATSLSRSSLCRKSRLPSARVMTMTPAVAAAVVRASADVVMAVAVARVVVVGQEVAAWESVAEPPT